MVIYHCLNRVYAVHLRQVDDPYCPPFDDELPSTSFEIDELEVRDGIDGTEFPDDVLWEK